MLFFDLINLFWVGPVYFFIVLLDLVQGVVIDLFFLLCVLKDSLLKTGIPKLIFLFFKIFLYVFSYSFEHFVCFSVDS